MFPRSKSFPLVRLTLAALVLMIAAVGAASAGPDLRKAYSIYKTSCLVLEIEKHKFLESVRLLEEERRRFSESCNTPSYYLYDDCRKSARYLGVWHRSADHHARNILRSKTECQKAKRDYLTALSEKVTEALLLGPAPDPNATVPTRRRSTGSVKRSPSRTRKPPSRRKSSVKKNRRRPPTRRHTTRDSQAAEFIGGLILFGLQQGIRSGSKRGGRGPNYIP